MLRCTLAGLIPLMMSEKYSSSADEFYQSQKTDFDRILKTKSYFLLRDLPIKISSQILLPEIPNILLKQKNDGCWSNSLRVTFDILSALKHVRCLCDLDSNKKMIKLREKIADWRDYDSLLLKLKIFGQTDSDDANKMNELIKQIQDTQNPDGSWEGTIVSTIYHVERLVNLEVPCDDKSVTKATGFLIDQLSTNWKRLQNLREAKGLKNQNDFLRQNRVLDFEAARKYKKEFAPKSVCYTRLGIIQNSLSLKLLIQLGLEKDDNVKSALDSTYSVYMRYNSLCYFRIRKRISADKRKHSPKNS